MLLVSLVVWRRWRMLETPYDARNLVLVLVVVWRGRRLLRFGDCADDVSFLAP